MRITATLILACSALLFVVADAADLSRPPSWPWSEDVVADAAGLPPLSEDAKTEYFGCCSPVIVRANAVIEALYGIYGHVSFNADWGPRHRGRRTCNRNDSSFAYVVI